MFRREQKMFHIYIIPQKSPLVKGFFCIFIDKKIDLCYNIKSKKPYRLFQVYQMIMVVSKAPGRE
jgi:hypothetical protein